MAGRLQEIMSDNEMAWRPWVAAAALAFGIAAWVLFVTTTGTAAVASAVIFALLFICLTAWAVCWKRMNRHFPKLRARLILTGPKFSTGVTPFLILGVIFLMVDSAIHFYAMVQSDQINVLETKRARLQGQTDFRKNALYGKNGNDGVLVILQALFDGKEIMGKPGSTLAGQILHLVPVSNDRDCAARDIEISDGEYTTQPGNKSPAFDIRHGCGIKIKNPHVRNFGQVLRTGPVPDEGGKHQ